MERNRRTSVQGIVVSSKMNKTIVVEVETHKKHAKYAKRVKYSNKYYAHDEKNEAKVGDTVTIMASRPLSATKRWRLVSIDQRAQEDVKVAEAELLAEEKIEEATKAEAVKEEAKVEAKVEEKKVEEVKAEAKPAKKAPAKKEASEEKAPAKKAPAKKPAAKKATAKKAEEK